MTKPYDDILKLMKNGKTARKPLSRRKPVI